MITKTCNIHGELTLDNIKTGIYKGKRYIKCRPCEIERSRRYHANIRENKQLHKKEKERHKKYWGDNKQKITERRKKPESLAKRRAWYANNKERYLPYYKELQQKYIKELSNTYVKRRVCQGTSLKFKDIPDSLVKAQREKIILYREIKRARHET